jgi:hypothetical protein
MRVTVADGFGGAIEFFGKSDGRAALRAVARC